MNMIWLLKQLLPLKYETVYRNDNDEKIFCSWRMWFGKSFNIHEFIIEP